MKSENSRIEVSHLSKKFCKDLSRSLWYGVNDFTSSLLLKNNNDKLREDEFWALNDISFDVSSGETFGIIGHNGAGKSTLLKVINGLLKPDLGQVKFYGKMGGLIDLAAGFSPILSGRENVFINASLLGFSKSEIKRRFDSIVEFAEVKDFIDAPLQTYSSGMRVRLGFAIAANLNPDILLIDEILSVGDTAFRERCYKHLLKFKHNGGTILFVSHNATVVESFCDRVMLLEYGQAVEISTPQEVVNRYEKKALELSKLSAAKLDYDIKSGYAGEDEAIRISSVTCHDLNGTKKSEFEYEEPFEIRIAYELLQDLVHPTFLIRLHKGMSSNTFCQMELSLDRLSISPNDRKGMVSCIIKNPRFSAGGYEIVINVRKHQSVQFGQKHYIPPQIFGSFEIATRHFFQLYPTLEKITLSNITPMVVDHDWQLI